MIAAAQSRKSGIMRHDNSISKDVIALLSVPCACYGIRQMTVAAHSAYSHSKSMACTDAGLR